MLSGGDRAARRRRQRARLYITAHGLYVADAQRPPRRRPRSSRPAGPPTRTGCATRPTTSPTSCSAGTQRPRGAARQRLVPRPARLPGPARASTATGWRCWPSWRSPPPTAPSTSSPPTNRGRPARATCSPTTSTTASAPICDVRRSAATGAGATPSSRSTPTSSRLVAPEGPPVRVTESCPAVEVMHLAVGQRRSSTSARTSSAGSGCGSAGGAAGDEVVGPPRRGARGRRARRPPAAHGEGHRLLRCSPARTRRCSSRALTFHGFRYAEVSGVAGPAGRRPRGRGRRLRPAPHRLVRLVQRAAQPLPRERRLGHARQLPRRPDRLPAARRAARLDRRHPGLLAHRQLPVRQRRLPHLWLADLAAEQQQDGSVPFVVPDVLSNAGPGGRGVGRRRDGRAVGALPAHRRRRGCSAASCRACAPGSTASPGSPAPTGSGPAASSSATGSTRRRRRTSPPRRRPTRTSSPPRTSPARPRSSRRPRRSLGDTDTSPRLRRSWPPRSATAFAARVRHRGRPRAQRRRRPPTRWRSQWALLPTRRAAARGPGAGWPTWCATSGFRISTGFVGTPLMTDALTDAGEVDARLPAAAADRLPVLALPGDDGRHHRVGALGQHAARRQHQPRRDDLVQPLRARRGRGLAAPHGRRARAGRARLPGDRSSGRCPAAV